MRARGKEEKGWRDGGREEGRGRGEGRRDKGGWKEKLMKQRIERIE